MTQGLQARNDWGWDNVHSPGTHSTPHQGDLIETHVASWKTWKLGEKRERRGRNTGRGTVWVGGWMIEKSCLLQRSCLMLFALAKGHISTVLVVGLLWNLSKMIAKGWHCDHFDPSLSFLELGISITITLSTPYKICLFISLKHALFLHICLLFGRLLYLVLTCLTVWLSFISKDQGVYPGSKIVLYLYGQQSR